LVKKISGHEVKCRDLLRYFRAYVDIFQVIQYLFKERVLTLSSIFLKFERQSIFK
jgi:hypothetical protein